MKQLYSVTYTPYECWTSESSSPEVLFVCEMEEFADDWIMEHMRKFATSKLMRWKSWEIDREFKSFGLGRIDYFT